MIRKNDLIILYGGDERSQFLIPFQPNQNFDTHHGQIKIPSEIDFGDLLISSKGKRFSVTRPTLIDRMMKVKRRTNIIYPKEAGMILLELDISPGKTVIEIGTGSGSLTTLFSTMVGSEGKVHSFERNKEHQEIAKKNIEKLGFSDRVIYHTKDPIEESDGFGIQEADAIFIDVPAPWLLISAAHDSLKAGGHIGTLSPNIEQIQETVETMEKTGFDRIRCMEIFTRGIRIQKNKTRPHTRMIAHTGYLLFAEKIKTFAQ